MAGDKSDDRQAQEARERRRDAKEPDTHRRTAGSIPLKAFSPAQAPMGTLGTGERRSRRWLRRDRQRVEQDGLRPEQGQPVPAQSGAGPIAPHKGQFSRDDLRFKRQHRLGSEGPQDGTDPAGLSLIHI